jgi:hypothetical protein
MGLLVWPSESHKYPKIILFKNFDATPRKRFADPLTAFNELFSDTTRHQQKAFAFTYLPVYL